VVGVFHPAGNVEISNRKKYVIYKCNVQLKAICSHSSPKISGHVLLILECCRGFPGLPYARAFVYVVQHRQTTILFRIYLLTYSHVCDTATVHRRKSTPHGLVAAAHSPVAVSAIQDGDRQMRSARLTGDACDVSSDTWRQLADVQHLDVEDASDELMARLSRHAAHLACLESLSVTWTPMKVVPGSWTRSLLPRLVSISLTRNRLRSVDGLEASCGRLEKLDLSNNLIAALPRHFGRAMPHLTSLVLTGNGLSALPESVGRLTRLRSLECAGNKLTKLPASIGDLSELSVLDVSGNNLTALPDSIGQLGKLEHLRASGNKLTAVKRQPL